jgi:hypothetical protein
MNNPHPHLLEYFDSERNWLCDGGCQKEAFWGSSSGIDSRVSTTYNVIQGGGAVLPVILTSVVHAMKHSYHSSNKQYLRKSCRLNVPLPEQCKQRRQDLMYVAQT